MVTKRLRKPSARCAYQSSCYLAEDLKCYGYKTDCALYRKTNGEELGVGVFDHAMNLLINRTREKHDKKAFKK